MHLFGTVRTRVEWGAICNTFESERAIDFRRIRVDRTPRIQRTEKCTIFAIRFDETITRTGRLFVSRDIRTGRTHRPVRPAFDGWHFRQLTTG